MEELKDKLKDTLNSFYEKNNYDYDDILTALEDVLKEGF